MDEILFTFRYEHFVGAVEQFLNTARKERFKEKKSFITKLQHMLYWVKITSQFIKFLIKLAYFFGSVE